MIKNEYFRYVKSKFNLLLFGILTIIGLLSFYMSYSEKKMFIQQLNSNSKDLNYEALSALLTNYAGMKFFTNFLFSNDFYQIFIIILFAGIGIFLAVIPFNHKDSGFGNQLVIRKNYNKYIREVAIAQILYIVTLISSVMTLLFIIAFIIGGFSFHFDGVGEYSLSFGAGLIISIIHISLLIAYAIIVNMVTLLIPSFINNKYLIQVFPIIAFIIAPMILGSTVANLSPLLGNVIYNLIPFVTLSLVPTFLVTNIPLFSLLLDLFPLFLLIVASFILYKKNINKFSKDYL